jgi:signal peptidase I
MAQDDSASADAMTTPDGGTSPQTAEARDGARAHERQQPAGTATRADATRGPGRKPKSRGVRAFLRDVAVILVAAIVISFLIKTFLIRSFYIPSESMEPTLLRNDRIIVNQLTPALMPIEHGDVVVFRDPGGWLGQQPPEPERSALVEGVDWVLSFVGLTAPDSNDHLIKRVIGMPGDRVVCCNELGQMTINGTPVDKPYLQLTGGGTAPSSIDFDVVVPDDSLWVMGDNRDNSRDSRYNQEGPTNGFVPYDNVVGRAILVSWPVSRWAWLDNHSEVFQDVEPRG